MEKSELNASEMKNYRLSFLSQLLEKVVQSRLQDFLDRNGLMPSTQSAYRKFHSTETAVTKIYNDLLLAGVGHKPPGHKPPRTEAPPDKSPPDRIPLGQKPPGQKPPSPFRLHRTNKCSNQII